MEEAEVVCWRWEAETRYYSAVLHRDLLGDWVLSVAHGGRGNRLGALVHRPVGSLDAGMLALQQIGITREKRHYTRTS